jgi:hypothetical protein
MRSSQVVQFQSTGFHFDNVIKGVGKRLLIICQFVLSKKRIQENDKNVQTSTFKPNMNRDGTNFFFARYYLD